MSNRIPFPKPYTSAHDLVCLLQSRGLTVTDTAKAESYLEYIGYYRLSAYMYPLLQLPKEQHRYKPNTTFSQVMMLYRFDKKLRLLIFNEIEKIEVAVRSAIVNIGSAMTAILSCCSVIPRYFTNDDTEALTFQKIAKRQDKNLVVRLRIIIYKIMCFIR